MDDETDNTEASAEELVRIQTFPTEETLEIEVGVTVGRVVIHLDAAGQADEARVEVRRDTSEKPPWVGGMNSLLSWVNERFGNQFGTDLDDTAEAVRQTRIEKVGGRLVVQASKALPLRNVPLSVTVYAPGGSHLAVRAGAADVTVTGAAGRADVSTGSGEVALDRADGSVTVRTGSGGIKLGPALSGLQLRTGSGDVEASSLSGSATLVTGTGDIWLGAAAGEILARSGSGDLSVADAASGSLELITGSGEVRIGVRPGVAAEIDLSSGAGKASSELEVAETPPEGGVTLKVCARTGSGNAVVTSAAQ
jgi:hypothetical protein